jgi:hypothetical protein
MTENIYRQDVTPAAAGITAALAALAHTVANDLNAKLSVLNDIKALLPAMSALILAVADDLGEYENEALDAAGDHLDRAINVLNPEVHAAVDAAAKLIGSAES